MKSGGKFMITWSFKLFAFTVRKREAKSLMNLNPQRVVLIFKLFSVLN